MTGRELICLLAHLFCFCFVAGLEMKDFDNV
jgi:hypothetical protein